MTEKHYITAEALLEDSYHLGAKIIESDFQPQFLLFGLGNEVVDGVILARKLEKSLGLPCEVMDTGAAVRTFNVLVLEGRQVGAAILAV